LAKENLLNLGAVGALMSGSGPTVFGLFENAETAEAAKQALSCDQEDQDVQLFLAEPILDADLKRIDI
jgi:4-diphosphocytidyl-2C-methyl-D-erythritol kinase